MILDIIEINFPDNPEEFNKFMRVIKNIENFFCKAFFDEEFYNIYANSNSTNSDYLDQRLNRLSEYIENNPGYNLIKKKIFQKKLKFKNN